MTLLSSGTKNGMLTGTLGDWIQTMSLLHLVIVGIPV